jgi:hypothetical protein
MISLASLQESILQPPRIVIYGTTGIGKTSFADGAPNPVFLCTESGLGLRAGRKKWDIRSYQDAMQAVSVLYTETHPFQTVVFDTADDFEPMLWRHVCATVPAEKGRICNTITDYGFDKGFRHAAGAWKQLMDGFTALRDHRDMTVIVCAHAKAQTIRSPDADDYQKYALQIDNKAELVIRAWADCLFFANYETSLVTAGRNDERNRAVGVGRRRLYTEERPAFFAKNRYSLPPVLPFDEGRAWADFMAAFNDSVNRSAQAPQPNTETTAAIPATAPQ